MCHYYELLPHIQILLLSNLLETSKNNTDFKYYLVMFFLECTLFTGQRSSCPSTSCCFDDRNVTGSSEVKCCGQLLDFAFYIGKTD